MSEASQLGVRPVHIMLLCNSGQPNEAQWSTCTNTEAEAGQGTHREQNVRAPPPQQRRTQQLGHSRSQAGDPGLLLQADETDCQVADERFCQRHGGSCLGGGQYGAGSQQQV